MQRELMMAFVLTRDPRRKGFRLVGRVVPFFVFDVVLYSGLPATGEVITFGEKGVCSELGGLVREQMAKNMEEKRMKLMWDKGGQKPNVFRHYMKVMKKLCKANKGQHQVE